MRLKIWAALLMELGDEYSPRALTLKVREGRSEGEREGGRGNFLFVWLKPWTVTVRSHGAGG